MQFVLLFFLLSSTALFSTCELLAAPLFVQIAVGGIAATAFVFGCWKKFFVLGFCVLSVPFFGYQGLQLVSSAFLLGALLRSREVRPLENEARTVRAALLILVFLFIAGGLRSFYSSVDRGLLIDIVSAGQFPGYAIQTFYDWHAVPLLILGYLIAYALFLLVAKKEEAEELLFGFAVGALCSAAMLILQLVSDSPFVQLNRSSFWVLAGRYAGLASDPNAFAVLSVILIPMLFFYRARAHRALFRLGAVAMLLAGPWSGSRSLWLGAVVFLLFYCCIRSGSKRAAALSVLGVALFVGILAVPAVNDKLQSLLPSPGALRILKTLHLHEQGGMLSSREMYSKIALEVWRADPMLGVGLGRFYDAQVDAARRLQIPLGEWRDNANNFYLHVLAEEGLLGLLSVIISFGLIGAALHGVDRALPNRPLFISLGVMFALLLLTGPHLLFDEVKYVLVGLLALLRFESPLLNSKPTKRWLEIFVFIFAAALLVAYGTSSAPQKSWRGLYAEESGADGSFYWTGKMAQIELCPIGKSETELRLFVANPDIEQRPVKLNMLLRDTGGGLDVRHVEFARGGWHSVSVLLSGVYGEDRKLIVELHVDHTFSPAEYGAPDRRVLGIMLGKTTDFCADAP